jgi:hypothetical protein
MITSRWIQPKDYKILKESLERDEYHKDGKPEFFYSIDACCNVYEDENGPIFFIRGYIDGLIGFQTICIDIQFVSNDDRKRNMEALVFANENFTKQCKKCGFNEFVFQTNSPKLKAFCMKYLGFLEVEGRMRKQL